MPYDEGLAERVREALEPKRGITERKMFGGLAFLAHGHMFVGIVGDVLMARIGPEAYDTALERPHVREMDFTGKPMKGYVFVDPRGLSSDSALAGWVQQCHRFVQTLPPKEAKNEKAKNKQTKK
jgi:TfoX/Sxy family transcriptional regulator of competence genes